MRVPLSWLKEFVEAPKELTPEQLHADLVRVGFEEEEIIPPAVTGPVVVAKVLEFQDEPQANGKTIRWCQVQVAPDGELAADGGEAVRGIVCGAHNFSVGDKVVVTLPGAVLPGDFQIAARKTYGHISDGMIASARELGLGEDHDGILILSTLGLDPQLGTDAKELLGISDSAVDINVTPDRGYALSIRGIAREYAASTGAKFTDPVSLVTPISASGYQVTIDDQGKIRGKIGATVFSTRVVRGVDTTRATPAWMVSRLGLAGIRSISLAVDITNYVMLEFGQPLHGYDLDKVQGGLSVRRAEPGETLTTLDGQSRKLHPEDLVIADESGAIGLAGVMGGAATELGSESTAVLIEAANFDPVSVARTARRHKLPSEASKRFERGVDPKVAQAAADRAVQLFVELAGAESDSLGSDYDNAPAPTEIQLLKDFASNYIGVDYTEAELVQALETIGAELSDQGKTLVVTPPSWRSDLKTQVDLVEEIARINGYDRIPSKLPVAPPGRGLSKAQRLRRKASNQLAAGGFTEVIAFPFLGESVNAKFEVEAVSEVAQVKLSNALDGEASYLRRSLLPGLLAIAHRNHSRGITDFAIFEQGLVFVPEAGQQLGYPELPEGGSQPAAEVLAGINAGIVPQPRKIAGVLLGSLIQRGVDQSSVDYDWRDAIDATNLLAHSLGVKLQLRQAKHQAFHPGRCAEIVAESAGELRTVGFAGELLPKLVEEYHLPRTVAAFELDLDQIIAVAPDEVTASEVASYPATNQDLTLVVPREVPAAELLVAVKEGAGSLLEAIQLVDDYRGEGLAAEQKALTMSLRFRANDRTLTAAEANEAKLAGVELAKTRHGAQLRD